MATEFDFIKDANPKALYLAGLNIDLPEYIQNYSIPSEEDVIELSDSAFADPVSRLHPIHEKSAALLSGIYLIGNGKQETPEMERVKQAAAVFSVEEELEAISEKMNELLNPPQEKSASEDDAEYSLYAMVVELDDGEVQGYYPVGNEVKIQKSAHDLYEDFISNKFPPDWTYKAASTIIDKAREHDVPMSTMPARIVTIGDKRLPDFETAEKLAEYREFDGASKEAVEIYKDIVKSASEDRENLDNYLKLWADMDITQGINYENTFTPQEAFFSGPAESDIDKMASTVVMVRDVMVPVSEFESVSEDVIRNTFREEIADVVSSSVKLASTDAPMASQYIAVIDEENQDLLLNILIS